MFRHALLTIAAALGLAACGSSNAPVVPTPTATPAPSVPAPAPTPAAFVCPLPALPDLHNECPKLKDGGKLQEFVNVAVDRAVAQHPELFDLTQVRGDSVKVLDRSRYIGVVVDNVHAQGVCANEQVEEIQVKNTNEFNEQYNVWSSDGFTRKAYITTCFPAQF